MDDDSANDRVLASFIGFCYAHPELRFWQALAAWSGHTILQTKAAMWEFSKKDQKLLKDTFYWEGKDEK